MTASFMNKRCQILNTTLNLKILRASLVAQMVKDPPAFLLQCMKVKSESEVAQSCPTLRNPMDCSLPGSPVRGIFQARGLEWGAIAFSRIKV